VFAGTAFGRDTRDTDHAVPHKIIQGSLGGWGFYLLKAVQSEDYTLPVTALSRRLQFC